MESFHTNQPVEILIVDDEPQAVKYFKKAFGAKYEVLTATSADEAESLVLSGDHILAGLSPKTIAKVKLKLDSSAARDTGGLGGSIGKLVKNSGAGAIGTHASYPLSEIRDIRFDGDQIVVDWKSGKHGELFGNTKVNGENISSSFRPDDAQRFVEAVRARMGLPAAR